MNPMTDLAVREGDYRDVLKDVRVDLIFTSPQYNIGSGGPRNDGYRKEGKYDPKSFGGIRDYPDNLPESEYQDQQVEFLLWAADHFTPNGVLAYNHKPRRRNGALIKPEKWLLRPEVEKRLVIAEEIIWDRGSTHNHDPHQMWAQTERIYFLRKPGGKYPLTNNKATDLPQKSDVWRVGSDVWRIGRARGVGHPSPFPVDLARAVILGWSKPGQMVCDPYAGSGTTGVAAKQLGRLVVGAEIMPKYAALANNRIAKGEHQMTDARKQADRTAARLLAQWPNTDINDKPLVITRCLEFHVDLRPLSGLGFSYDDVRRCGLEYQLLASAAAQSYRIDELHAYAQKLYDADRDIEKQSHEFFAAQAVYRMASLVADGRKADAHVAIAAEHRESYRAVTQEALDFAAETKVHALRLYGVDTVESLFDCLWGEV